MKPKYKVSELHVYSYGLVASNKLLSSLEIEVTPLEELSMVDGEISEHIFEETVSAADSSGKKTDVKLNSSNSVTATWLPIGQPNRQTPPNVRRGEQVVLYKFGDAERIYWNTLRNDLRFRKLETVVFAFSATSKEDVNITEDNCYVFEVSSHTKQIRLHTSQANGEPFGYDILLDLDLGNFSIRDTDSNFFLFDSAARTMRYENKDGSYFDITKSVFELFTGDSGKIKTTNLTVEASDIQVKTDTMEYTASTSTTIVSPITDMTSQTTHKGNIGLAGALSQTGGGGGGGGGECSFESPLKVKNTVTMEGAVTAETSLTTPSLNAGTAEIATVLKAQQIFANNIRYA